jgi:hypothetical protein
MKLIATTTVGSGGTETIVLSSIPQSFTDLQLVLSLRNSPTAVVGDIPITFNGTGTGYSARILYGTGTGVASFTETSITVRVNASSSTANTFGNTSVYIPNYAGSTFKSVSTDEVVENNAASSHHAITARLWSNTAAITSITIGAGTTILENSTVSLYGITKGSDGITTAS